MQHSETKTLAESIPPQTGQSGPEFIERRVQALIAEHRFNDASLLAGKLRQNHADRLGGWMLGALIAQRSGDFPLMLELALGAVQIGREQSQADFMLCDALIMNGDIAGAIQRLVKLRNCLPEGASEWELLSSKFFQLGKIEDAYSAAANAPYSNSALALKAVAAMALGRLEEAEALYDEAIQAAPHETDTYYSRAILRRFTENEKAVLDTKARLAQSSLGAPETIPLHYALAKIFEDQGDHSSSFAQLEKGATIRRKHMAYRVQTDEQAMRHIAPDSGALFK